MAFQSVGQILGQGAPYEPILSLIVSGFALLSGSLLILFAFRPNRGVVDFVINPSFIDGPNRPGVIIKRWWNFLKVLTKAVRDYPSLPRMLIWMVWVGIVYFGINMSVNTSLHRLLYWPYALFLDLP